MLFVVSVIWYCAIGNNCYCVVSSFQNLKNKSWRDSGTTEKRSSKIVQRLKYSKHGVATPFFPISGFPEDS
ncbi:unnamed protein product [Allacma fusca]|uniref:Uncharacterized protein n=1 Tax=Allacma fusca TaxID=39272 RepID=A0A8J2PUR4_9HEXA|nr:unnamed protein product [Allacma fusca]